MPVYVAPFTFQYTTNLIEVDGGVTDVSVIDLWTAIKLARATEQGVPFDRIADGSGLNELGPGVETGLTVELLDPWQLKFPDGNYIARVSGGNLIGGPGGDPIAYSAGVQTLLIQSAASTVVTVSVPTAAQNAAAVWASELEGSYTAAEIQRMVAAVMAGKSSGHPSAPVFRDLTDTEDRVSGTVDGDGNRTSVTLNP